MHRGEPIIIEHKRRVWKAAATLSNKYEENNYENTQVIGADDIFFFALIHVCSCQQPGRFRAANMLYR